MKHLLILIFSVLFPLFSSAALFIECTGRSFLHRVHMDDFATGAFRYQVLYFFGERVQGEFPVDLVAMNLSEQIFRLGNPELRVGVAVDGDGTRKVLRGVEGVQGTGAASARGITQDPIRTCWINPKLIPK